MKIEIRSADLMHISGYVNAVERDSRVLPPVMAQDAKGPFVEQVAAGAFSRALAKGGNVKLCLNHGREIGSTKDGTLKLHEDNIGLYADTVVTDPETVQAAIHGEVRGWSFGFFRPKAEWNEEHNRRRLIDFDVDEVSLLTTKTPAYIGTSVELRSAENAEEDGIIEHRAMDDTIEVTDLQEKPPAVTEVPEYRAAIEILKLKAERN